MGGLRASSANLPLGGVANGYMFHSVSGNANDGGGGVVRRLIEPGGTATVLIRLARRRGGNILALLGKQNGRRTGVAKVSLVRLPGCAGRYGRSVCVKYQPRWADMALS